MAHDMDDDAGSKREVGFSGGRPGHTCADSDCENDAVRGSRYCASHQE